MASQGTMFDENSNASATPISAGQMPAVAAAATPSTAIVSQLLNVKDSRWLQVEVCREFQRGQCTRSDQECKFAHPPPHVDVQQGRVTACYDSIKGRCTRENPKCKYLHPPQHIKDQLLINGRNNLALKNLISAQLNSGGGQPMVNPLQSLQHIQLQQQAGLAAANMIPTLPYHYYQGMMYPAAMLQAADPYQAAVTQQLQAAALLQSSALLQPGMLAAQQLAAVAAAAQTPSISAAPTPYGTTTYPSRKRTITAANGGDDDDRRSHHSPMLNMSAAAAAAAAGVPCKRPAVDKNGAVVYGTAAQPGTQAFNPYLLQGLQGYVPAVSFGSGQVPPRY